MPALASLEVAWESDLMGDDVEGSRERELQYLHRLLDLGSEGELSPLLDRALALIVELTQARLAYLELHHDDASGGGYWRAHGCTSEDVSSIRASISRGVIQATLAAGETLETPSAKDDPRFAMRGSVQLNDIDAVLCTPIGRPPLGVLYLQGRSRGDSFTPPHRAWAERFARQVGLVAERVRGMSSKRDRVDHTTEIRRRFPCPGLIGRSRALARSLNEASAMAPLDIGVLITGPSGTGKTALARAIHDNSKRAGRTFIAVNCGAIPSALAESELFGAERGAHSTASQRTLGKVGAAQGGTLFLDEIGELPNDVQTKLLQLLQDFQYYPLGSSQIAHADIRVIAATNVDLRERVQKNTFRRDLFYRINVVTIEMPGLADRREDIGALVLHFAREACARHRLPALEVARRTILAAEDETWVGEVRELANVVESGVIRATTEGSATLAPHHLFPTREPQSHEPLEYREATRRFQRRYLLDVLTECDWNIADAVRQLGLARSQIYNLVAQFELKRPKDSSAG